MWHCETEAAECPVASSWASYLTFTSCSSSFSPLLCNSFPNHSLWSIQILLLFNFSGLLKFIRRFLPYCSTTYTFWFVPLLSNGRLIQDLISPKQSKVWMVPKGLLNERWRETMHSCNFSLKGWLQFWEEGSCLRDADWLHKCSISDMRNKLEIFINIYFFILVDYLIVFLILLQYHNLFTLN